MTTLDPTSALVRVDLPALGRPTKDAKPLRNSGTCGLCHYPSAGLAPSVGLWLAGGPPESLVGLVLSCPLAWPWPGSLLALGLAFGLAFVWPADASRLVPASGDATGPASWAGCLSVPLPVPLAGVLAGVLAGGRGVAGLPRRVGNALARVARAGEGVPLAGRGAGVGLRPLLGAGAGCRPRSGLPRRGARVLVAVARAVRGGGRCGAAVGGAAGRGAAVGPAPAAGWRGRVPVPEDFVPDQCPRAGWCAGPASPPSPVCVPGVVEVPWPGASTAGGSPTGRGNANGR